MVIKQLDGAVADDPSCTFKFEFLLSGPPRDFVNVIDVEFVVSGIPGVTKLVGVDSYQRFQYDRLGSAKSPPPQGRRA